MPPNHTMPIHRLKNPLQIINLLALSAGISSGAALAAIPSHIRPGLWQAQMTMSVSMRMNGQTMSVPDKSGSLVYCSDGSLGAVENQGATGEDDCTTSSSSFSGNTLNVTSSCPGTLGLGGPLITHMTLVFENDTAMRMVSNGTAPGEQIHMQGDWKWLGACPAGAAPGDTGQMVGGNFEKGAGAADTP